MQDAFPKMHYNLRKGWKTTLRTEARQTPGRAATRRWVGSDQSVTCLPRSSCGTREPHQSCHISIHTVKEAPFMIRPGWDARETEVPCGCGAPCPDGEPGATPPWTSTAPCTPLCHCSTDSAPKPGPGHQHFIARLLKRSHIQWRRNYLNKKTNLSCTIFPTICFFFFFLIFVLFPTCRSLQPFCCFKTLL